jgi:hypothetical protein
VLKSKRHISFRVARPELLQAPAVLPDARRPTPADAANPEAWERFLRRVINFFYQCAAVGDVAIGHKGDGYYHWTIRLRSDNPPGWLKPHLKELMDQIQEVREAGAKPRVQSLLFVAPGYSDVLVKDRG